jgi:hypothetical protein
MFLNSDCAQGNSGGGLWGDCAQGIVMALKEIVMVIGIVIVLKGIVMVSEVMVSEVMVSE